MKVTKDTRIGVLMGGLSRERDISLRSGKAVACALRSLGYAHVEEIDVSRDVADVLRKNAVEAAFVMLHGRFGEDGTIQGVLEFLRIPYTGSGVAASAVAMDKFLTKRLFEAAGVPTPPYLTADAATPHDLLSAEVSSRLGFPVVAKPLREGSTIGLAVVNAAQDVSAAQAKALEFDDVVLWERFVGGVELTVGFLSGKALPIVEIVPAGGLFDFEAKYTKGRTEYFCPARIPEEAARDVTRHASAAFAAVGASSFGRVDLKWDKGRTSVLEVNTIPGMTETSLVPMAVRAQGGSFEGLVEAILMEASLKA